MREKLSTENMNPIKQTRIFTTEAEEALWYLATITFSSLILQ